MGAEYGNEENGEWGDGRDGQPRLRTEPTSDEEDYGHMGTTDHRGTWRNPTEQDGTQRNANKRDFRPESHHFRAFRTFAPLVPPLPTPFPKTQRFGGFETPGIGWGGYRGEENGQWAQWIFAGLDGTPSNHGEQEHKYIGPPWTLTAPDGTPRNTNTRALRH